MASESVEPTADPRSQVAIGFDAVGRDIDEATHRASGEIHRASVWSLESLVMLSRTDADAHVVADDSATHFALDKEAEPAEHFLLSDRDLGREGDADAFSKVWVVQAKAVIRCPPDIASRGGAPRERLG